jgi:hypothetical protein
MDANISLKQALAHVWPDAKPGVQSFLCFSIHEHWVSFCRRHHGNDSHEETLPLEIAIPFTKNMIPVAICELNKRFIMATCVPKTDDE